MWQRLMLMAGFAAFLHAQPVAVIAVLEGNAVFTDARDRPHPAQGLDWLLAGTLLETAPGARLVLAFANGRRCEIGAASKISIGVDGPKKISGILRELEKLPPMPKLPVIALASRAPAMGGLRVRELNAVRLLFPRDGLSTLPDHTVLRFAPEETGPLYKIEVSDQTGKVLFQSETAATKISIPPGALRPEQSYRWRVRGGGDQVLGQAAFTTVSEDTIARRTTFKAAVSGSDPDTFIVLAAMDAQLGLFDEAIEELRAAIPRSAHSDPIRRLLAAIEGAMR